MEELRLPRPRRLDGHAGAQGEGPGQFDAPAAIALDRQGNIYVADWGNHRIQKFSPDGALVGLFGTDGNGPFQVHEHDVGVSRRTASPASWPLRASPTTPTPRASSRLRSPSRNRA